MITPQDIREKTFEKAVFGGYDMATVDTFMEEVANDLALLMKENGVLKGQRKVLVDKVEEYRGNEDALRMAMLSAQRLGGQIEKESKDKADAIISDAKREAQRIIEEATYESKAEKLRLEEAKSVSAKFIDSMDMLCHRQLEFLAKMNELDFIQQLRRDNAASASRAAPPEAAPAGPAAPAAAPAAAPEEAPKIHEAVKVIGETVAKVMDEPVVNVRPEMSGEVVEDERPTRSYNIVTDPDDLIDRPASLADDGK